MSFICVFANTNNRSIPPQDCSNMVCAAIINREIFSTIVHQTLCLSSFLIYGAGDQIRTDDNYVGNVVLYQLSYTREGAFDRTRTCDPRFTKPLLYQLSYNRVVLREGLEHSRPYGQRIFIPVCLPIPPPKHAVRALYVRALDILRSGCEPHDVVYY